MRRRGSNVTRGLFYARSSVTTLARSRADSEWSMNHQTFCSRIKAYHHLTFVGLRQIIGGLFFPYLH